MSPNEEDWLNVLIIMNAQLSKKSPLNMIDESGVDLTKNFTISKGPEEFAYLFLPETNVCSRTLTMPNGKEINIGLRSVGRKLTLCYLNGFVMCDIDISRSKMSDGIDSIKMCRRIYNQVVDFAKERKNLVKADTAAAVSTVKGMHIYFETADEYSPKENYYEMALFLRQVCDGNYVLKWYLDQTRGFCDKVFGTYRFDDKDVKEKCHIMASKHAEKACSQPLFMEPKSENTQFLLKFRREFSCRILKLDCLSLDSLQIFGQNVESTVIGDILDVKDKFKHLYKNLIKEGFSFKYLILLLATFTPRTRFSRTESEDEKFKQIRKGLTSLFYGKDDSMPSAEVDHLDSFKKWGFKMEEYKNLLQTKLEEGHEIAIGKEHHDLKEEIYKDSVEELMGRRVSSDLVTLLIAFDINMPYSSRVQAMTRIMKHDERKEFLEKSEYDLFMSEDNSFLTNLEAFRFARDLVDGTSNMNSSLMPVFLVYLEELFSHAIIKDQKISRNVLRQLFDPVYFELLQLPAGQHMLSKMTQMPDLVKLYKVWNLKNTDSVPVLDTLQLPLSNIDVVLGRELLFKIKYSFEDVKGFKKREKEFVSPTEEELNFYKLLHNAITLYCTMSHSELFGFAFDVKWEFVANYEDSARLHSELSMLDLIDVGGITRDFITSMAPRLKDLMIRDNVIAFMLAGDLLIMKMELQTQFTLPLFDNINSYMYLLCGDAEACKCDLLIDSVYNKKGYTCETVGEMIDEGFSIDQVYTQEDTLRSYLKTNMESKLQDFALTILCRVIKGVSRKDSPNIYHSHIYGDTEWRSDELDVFFKYNDYDDEGELGTDAVEVNKKLSDLVLSDRKLHFLVAEATKRYEYHASFASSSPEANFLLVTYTDIELVIAYQDIVEKYVRVGVPKKEREILLQEFEQSVDKYIGFRKISNGTEMEEKKWELDVMKMLNEYVPFDFKRFLHRIDPSIYHQKVKYVTNPSMKSFYLTYIALRLFKETDVQLNLFMYDAIEIRKLDASKLDQLNLNAKEKHFVKVIKNHVSKLFMDFVQGNSDVTADSIMKVLDVRRYDIDSMYTFHTDAATFLFEKMLQMMTKSELKQVLKFATGMDTVPVFPEFKFKLVGQSYPTTWFGHTCFYSLDMSDKFKEIVNNFVYLLIDSYDNETTGGDPIEKEYIYEEDNYDFPSKVRKEKERLIEHILSSGTTSQSDTCVRDSAPVVASVPIEAASPMASRLQEIRERRLASPPVASSMTSRRVPIRRLAQPPERRPAPLDPPAPAPLPAPLDSNITGRSAQRAARAARRAALGASSSETSPPEPITPRTPERPVSSSSSSPPRIRRPVNHFDPSRRDRLESVVSSILDFYVKE